MQMEKNAVFTNEVYSFCAYLTQNEFFFPRKALNLEKVSFKHKME